MKAGCASPHRQTRQRPFTSNRSRAGWGCASPPVCSACHVGGRHMPVDRDAADSPRLSGGVRLSKGVSVRPRRPACTSPDQRQARLAGQVNAGCRAPSDSQRTAQQNAPRPAPASPPATLRKMRPSFHMHRSPAAARLSKPRRLVQPLLYRIGIAACGNHGAALRKHHDPIARRCAQKKLRIGGRPLWARRNTWLQPGQLFMAVPFLAMPSGPVHVGGQRRDDEARQHHRHQSSHDLHKLLQGPRRQQSLPLRRPCPLAEVSISACPKAIITQNFTSAAITPTTLQRATTSTFSDA